MQLLPQKKSKYNIFPIFAVTTFGLNLLTLFILIFHGSILHKLSTKLPPSLVQLVDGRAITVESQTNLERHPAIIRRFVGQTMTLMFTWSENQSPQTVWQTTSLLLSENLRQKFELEFSQGVSGKNLANAIAEAESLLLIREISQPQKISDGKWQVEISANRIISSGKVQGTSTIPLKKKILIQATDTQQITLPNSPIPLHTAVSRLGEARLEIYNICDIKDHKCLENSSSK